MLRSRKEKQQGMEVVILEQMVPENHLLRKIDRSIDFSFINKLCAPLYSENVGRPAVDPEILFRMLFVGYLYGIRSERRLEEEINYNFAYKWFCGLGLTEKAPDATTISVNRTRRFRDNNIAEKIFQEILRQAVEKKLVGGEILYTDSTHVKAKANKHKKTTVTIEKSPKAYMEELDAAIAADRDALGKKPFEKKDDDEPPTTQIQQSKNDPESGQLHKEGKPDGFHYSEHRTVDSKNNIVVNVRITPANVNDVDPVTDILDDIEKRLGHLPSYMGVDAGYHNAPTCHQIASRGIQPVVGYRRHTHKGEHWGKYHFVYQKDKNVYLCPQKHELTWKTTNRAGYREYWSDSKVCSNCPCREKCLSSSMTRRLVTRHVWQDDLEQADAFTKTLNGKRIYAWRKQTIERSFAEAKELHGLRYARMLGIRNMYEQSFLTAAVQNMKRIVKAIFSCFISLLYAKTPYPLLKTWRFSAVWGFLQRSLLPRNLPPTSLTIFPDFSVKVQYIGNTKAKKREPRCGKIEAQTAIKHRRVLHGNGNTGSILSSTGFEPCSKARSHSRSDPVPHEPKNGTQVEKAVRWDRGKPAGSAAYAPSFSTPADSR